MLHQCNPLKFCQFFEILPILQTNSLILPILRTNSFKLLFLNSPKAFYAANSISRIWAQPNPKKPEIPRYGLNPTRPEFPKYGLNPTRKNPNFPAMGSTRPEKTRNLGQNGWGDPIFTLLEWTKKLKIPEFSCPEVLALSTTRLDPNFPAIAST